MNKFNFTLFFLTLLLCIGISTPQVSANNSFKEVSFSDDIWKTWTITANKTVHPKTVTSENIFVLDAYNNPVDLIIFQVTQNQIKVSPVKPYQYNHTYTMYLTDAIHSIDNLALSPTKFQFVIKEPLVEQLSKIDLTEDLYALITNADYQKFSLDLLVNEEIVGGYETANGITIQNHTIGKSVNTSPIVTTNIENKTYYFFYDTTTNLLRAIYWELNTANAYFTNWVQSTSFERTVALSKLNILLTNEFRIKENMPMIVFDEALTSTAYKHSEDMAINNYFSHTSLDGRTLGDRAWSACSNCFTIGENIAANQKNIFLAHHTWINSSGHRMNMLNSNFTKAGLGFYHTHVGKYQRYYTTNFGGARSK